MSGEASGAECRHASGAESMPGSANTAGIRQRPLSLQSDSTRRDDGFRLETVIRFLAVSVGGSRNRPFDFCRGV